MTLNPDSRCACPSKTESGIALAAVLSGRLVAHQTNGTKTKTVETSHPGSWSQILDRIKSNVSIT